MTDAEALALDEDLSALGDLRRNRFWKNHVVPEIERMMSEHRVAKRDRTLPPHERCEHITAEENARQLLEFMDKAETMIRAKLKEHDAKTPIITRAFSSIPQ